MYYMYIPYVTYFKDSYESLCQPERGNFYKKISKNIRYPFYFSPSQPNSFSCQKLWAIAPSVDNLHIEIFRYPTLDIRHTLDIGFDVTKMFSVEFWVHVLFCPLMSLPPIPFLLRKEANRHKKEPRLCMHPISITWDAHFINVLKFTALPLES